MKTMTCRQMGGPCDAPFHGTKADEVIRAEDNHLKEMVARGDETHESALKSMQDRWRNPISEWGGISRQGRPLLLFPKTDLSGLGRDRNAYGRGSPTLRRAVAMSRSLREVAKRELRGRVATLGEGPARADRSRRRQNPEDVVWIEACVLAATWSLAALPRRPMADGPEHLSTGAASATFSAAPPTKLRRHPRGRPVGLEDRRISRACRPLP